MNLISLIFTISKICLPVSHKKLFQRPYCHKNDNFCQISRFRDGTSNGGWLRHTEQVTHNRMTVFLGCQQNITQCTDIKSDALQIPGFQYLSWLLPHHLDVPELYFLLTALMMGQPAKLLPTEIKFDLDSVWAFLWGNSINNQPIISVSPRINLSPEAVISLLEMTREVVHSNENSLPTELSNHPISIVQVRFFLLFFDLFIIYGLVTPNMQPYLICCNAIVCYDNSAICV